jgi:hypothetical protein
LVTRIQSAKTEIEREKQLRTAYQPPKKGAPSRSAQQDLQKLRTGLVTESLQQLNMVLPQLQGPQPFEDLISETLGAIGIYLGVGEEVQALEILQKDNQSLKTQVRELSEKLDRRNEDLATMRRRMGTMQEEIDTLRRRG